MSRPDALPDAMEHFARAAFFCSEARWEHGAARVRLLGAALLNGALGLARVADADTGERARIELSAELRARAAG